MAEHFGYYDDWKTHVLECPDCGWKGTFEDGTDWFEQLMDCSCPHGDKMLAIVPYPTIDESEQNWDKLTEQERKDVNQRKHFLSELKIR